MARILLVEDSVIQAVNLRQPLEDAGTRAVFAPSADAALRMLGREPFELLLAGVSRDADGVELCRRVRSDAAIRLLPVVLIVSAEDVAGLAHALAAGATDTAVIEGGAKGIVEHVQATLRRPVPVFSATERAAGEAGHAGHEHVVHLNGDSVRVRASTDQLLNAFSTALEGLQALRRQHVELTSRFEAELRQRKDAERAVRDSEAIYHSLVNHVPVSMFRKNVNGEFTFANEPFCRELDRPLHLIVGRTDYDFFPAELAEKYRENDLEVIRTGRVFDDVEAHRTPDGQQLYVQVLKAPVHNSDGEIIGVQVVFWDVTAKHAAEEELRAGESRKQAIFDASLDCMIISDGEGRIVEFNRAAERTFGYRRDEVLGRDMDELLFSPTYGNRSRHNLERYTSTHEEGSMLGRRVEVPLVRRNGENFIAEMVMQPFSRGSQVQFATVLHDITRRKDWERQLQSARDAAEAASRAKSDFLANMSHEIRTPMNAIIGMTELVLGTELESQQREHLLIVQDSAEALLDLINDILDFSKIEAGRLDLESVAFPVRDRIEDTMKSLAVRAHERNLELACHIHPNVPFGASGDPGRLRQILVNLVGNAIKFTDEGEVVLDVERVPAPNPNEIRLRFSVTDTGIGIPQDKQKLIFKAFEQADTSTTRRFGGTGLGLAISSRLVKLMGGRLQVQSEVGTGSRFHFVATLGVADEFDVVLAHQLPAATLAGQVVLVVDDNLTNRRILDEMLRNWGLQPVICDSALAAIDALKTRTGPDVDQANRVGLIITDVSMPVMDGFSFVEVIRRDFPDESFQVIMLTSADRPGDLSRCRQLGIQRYITKPVKQSDLLAAIEKSFGMQPLQELSSRTVRHDVVVSLRPLRILLVEDSATNQLLARALLSREGHTVDVAENGRIAVEKAGGDYDVILMDIQMPEMDGYQATRHIREAQQASGRRIPIVAMTAHALKGDRELCIAAGMDDYVSKPIRTNELFKVLQRVLPDGNGQQAAPTDVGISDSVLDDDEPGDHDSALDDVYESAPPTVLQTPEAMTALAPATHIENTTRQVDWSAAFKTVGDDSGLLVTIIDAVLEECPRLQRYLAESIASGDAKSVRRAAHTIKGNMRTFEAPLATAAAARLEQIAAGGDLTRAAEVANSLHPLLEAVFRELRAWKSAHMARLATDLDDDPSDSVLDD